VSDLEARFQPRKVELVATVIRADGTQEELGTIAVWHRSRFKRLLAKLGRAGKITMSKD